MKNFLIDDINVRWMSSKVKARSKKFFYTDSGGGSMAILTLEHVGKQYTSKWKGGHTVALEDVSMQVEENEFVVIMGESGAGKSTLLNLLACFDDVSEGDIKLQGKSLVSMKEEEKAMYRRDHIGFVFQDFSLLDSLSVEDNILLPCVLSEKNIKEKKDYMNELCTLLHIDGLQKRFPYELSGGQQQRVAIARALINQPEILLADEPSGALDSKSSMQLLEQFCELQKKGQSILMVTHSPMAASYGDRVVFLKDGKIVNEIYKGEDSRQEFYNRLVHMLSVVESRDLHED